MGCSPLPDTLSKSTQGSVVLGWSLSGDTPHLRCLELGTCGSRSAGPRAGAGVAGRGCVCGLLNTGGHQWPPGDTYTRMHPQAHSSSQPGACRQLGLRAATAGRREWLRAWTAGASQVDAFLRSEQQLSLQSQGPEPSGASWTLECWKAWLFRCNFSKFQHRHSCLPRVLWELWPLASSGWGASGQPLGQQHSQLDQAWSHQPRV